MEPDRLSKLEQLRQEPPIRIMDRYDLSGDSLTEFPDLSMYAIRSLDLSHNLLDTIHSERLPLGLVNLNMSHNRLSGELTVKYLALPHLHELDLSYNALTAIHFHNYVERIILSHNKLGWEIGLGEGYRIAYVDISHNENIYKAVRFNPKNVDTLICEGLPGGDEVVYSILFNSAEGEAAGWEKVKRALRLEAEYGDNKDSLQKAVGLTDEAMHMVNGFRRSLYEDMARLLLTLGKEKKALETILKLDHTWKRNQSYLLQKAIYLECNGQKTEADSIYSLITSWDKKYLRKSPNNLTDVVLKSYMVNLYLCDGTHRSIKSVTDELYGSQVQADTIDKKGDIRRLLQEIHSKDRREALIRILKDPELTSRYFEL